MHPLMANEILAKPKRLAAAFIIAYERLDIAVDFHVVPKILVIGEYPFANSARMQRALEKENVVNHLFH